ncbi:MAG: pyridoxal phosphate-dependent aminotransferase [Hoeflea sp.]|uniref:pyridoxal phosphate-dependent aminotransferase n=1 Tax=Hoeflea sp. TaxID=1940281 RepID=UPI001D45C40C|nr:pyridoxal phosphate-dependent aminotransferase [Hoeflea sp.]MBU4529063.1 pyridoxal phosphate-dependent aminotransferase [Alphaproteobacteria bacterium]MBU4543468.1 pyridoxal phosphate-dependent aminotransferase [Alphaproteobacteria bacterium]MBU4549093.1 pyridoxal phosphate-dependent aminotransferase [Alphaproteobacteria bacterium]MBV1725228.1 pyridoxal phosphate-dependent aminotransferase [Hoeflea sp.]MBV1785189.1 pyridoxal phosphate-dependent aminotransferase [Hoeflea sp.]
MHYAAITERLAHTGGAKWAIHQRCRAMKKAGADIIELTIGEPDQPPDPQLFEICHASMLAGRTGYSSGRGEPDLLEAIAARYSRRRPGVDANNVMCFPGTQTALFATMMALTGPGDGVLVGDPFYATYEGVIVASGAHRESVPLRPENGFRMKAEDLESAITPQSRVLLLNSPHNPTGAVLGADEIARIGAVCRKNNLWIVADEVYEELVFDGTFASPFDNPDLADRVIALSSISKSHAAPGFRSGWAVGPHEFCERLLPLSETMLFGNQPFIADMTAFALNADLPTSARMRASYKSRAAMFADTLDGLDGVKPFRPQAGMFIVLDVSGTGLDGETFAWRLLEAGVAVMPGSSFGANAGALVRLSLTVPDESVIEACGRIAKFVEGI